jgi:uncharacterized protein YlxW (UPF0749 family)
VAEQQVRSRAGRLGALAVFAVAGGLFATSATTADGRQLRSEAGNLPGLVLREEARVAERTDDVSALRQEIDVLAAAQDDPRANALAGRAEALVPAAGTDAVRGPGVSVVLDDAPRGQATSASVDADLLLVHQQDLQAVVNALWAGGAESIALMDQPIISTSAVRCVGNTLRLQGRLYAPPYEVTAIGDPDALVAALDASPEVAAYREYQALGLGWELRRGDDLRVPAWDGPLELRHARPVSA